MFISIGKANAITSVGIISDTLLTQTTPYNYYYKTPDFIIQDLSDALKVDNKIQVIPYSKIRETVKKKTLINNDTGYLRSIQNGYDLNFELISRIAKEIEAEHIIVVTSSVEMQRDFLKNTLWNALNIGGYDTINPTHRISVYIALVNVEHELVLWEGLYAKDIRNNKLKNLDTAISGNQEGLMRIKRYSKFITPDIARNIRTSLGTYTFKQKYEVETRALLKVAHKKFQLGSTKNLNNPDATIENIEAYKDAYDKKMEKIRIENEKERARKAVLKEKKRLEEEKIKAQNEKLKMQEKQQKEFEKLQKEKDDYKIFKEEEKKGFNWFGLKK